MLISIKESTSSVKIEIDDKNLKNISSEELLILIRKLLSKPANYKREYIEDLLIASLMVTDCKIIRESANDDGNYEVLYEIKD